jgi:hypothetical protein
MKEEWVTLPVAITYLMNVAHYNNGYPPAVGAGGLAAGSGFGTSSRHYGQQQQRSNRHRSTAAVGVPSAGASMTTGRRMSSSNDRPRSCDQSSFWVVHVRGSARSIESRTGLGWWFVMDESTVCCERFFFSLTYTFLSTDSKQGVANHVHAGR